MPTSSEPDVSPVRQTGATFVCRVLKNSRLTRFPTAILGTHDTKRYNFSFADRMNNFIGVTRINLGSLMAGIDGNRGYLIQTLIALLDSLRSDNWDSVTIEPSHESEIVDIVWATANHRIAKQVKSSINQINLPDAKRWAKELESKSDADELELILVCNGASDSVIKVERIGKVRVPCPKNLDWDGLLSEAAHLLDRFLYSIGLSSVSPDHSRLIVKGLVTEMSIHASTAKPLSRDDLSNKLRCWVKVVSLEGLVSLHESVLSKSPRSVRPNLALKLIGRDEEARWLRETNGDKLIIGQPGIGKTYLLLDYVRNESSFFLCSDNQEKIERAVRSLAPKSIIVEDAHIHADTVEFLRRLRTDSVASFEIVADCWPGSRDIVIGKLGVRKSSCLELEPISNQAIIDIVRDFGINPSNSFLHMVVWQSNGYPGRAAMLVETCLGGTHEDYDDFWNGETLARWVRTRFADLLGKESIQVLACFAIGGSAGINSDLVARVLQLSRGRVLQIVSELALGGVVVDLSSGRLAVVPGSIRPILVRDYFFGNARIPIDEFLNDQMAYSEIVTTISNSCALGADLPNHDLRTLVKKSDSRQSWAALINTSKENAQYVFEKKKELVPYLARDFLSTVPNLAITQLLCLADGDFRPLHSNTDHPLRQLSDWVKSGFPSSQALLRRKLLFDTFCDRKNENIDLLLRLLPIFVSPEYVNTEQNPGNRMEFTIRSGCVTVEDLRGIAGFWPDLLECLRSTCFNNWESVLEGTREWLWPHFSGGVQVSDEQREVIHSSATEILGVLTELAENRPGVLRTLDRIASAHSFKLSFEIAESYDVLFPNVPPYNGDDENRQSEFAALIARAHLQGEVWAKVKPNEVIAEISQCIDEAKLTGRPWPDLCLACCEAISSKAGLQIPWLHAILNSDIREDLLYPFMRRAIDANEAGWESTISVCLASEKSLTTAMKLALTHSNCTRALVDQAIAETPKAIETLRTTVMHFDLDDAVVSKLLNSTESAVVAATLEGIWHKLKKSPREASWYEEWRRGVIEHLDDDYCLKGALNDDSRLRHEWLTYLASSKEGKPRLKLDDIKSITYQMSDVERRELIDRIDPAARNAKEMTIALIGTSVERYKKLLGMKNLERVWSAPLQRSPDETWNNFAVEALKRGIRSEAIVGETRLVLSQIGPIPQKCHDEIDAWAASLEFVDPELRPVVELGLVEARREFDHWKRWERERDI